MELATSGISGLDAQLGGGFPRGSTILVIGDPCNALSAFAEQFIAGGLAQAEASLYFQFDRPAATCTERIRSLAKDMGGAKAAMKVFDAYTGQFGADGREAKGRADEPVLLGAENALGEVLHEALQVGAGRYRLAMDSLSSAVQPGKEQEVVDFVRNLAHLGRETGGLHLLTLVRGLHEPHLESRLKHLATGVLEMGLERKGFGLYNFLQVTKMLELRDPTRLLLFRETDKGLWLESTKRVF